MIRLEDVIFDAFSEVMLVKPPQNVGQIAKLLSRLLTQEDERDHQQESARSHLHIQRTCFFTVDGEYGGSRTRWHAYNVPSAIKLRSRPPSHLVTLAPENAEAIDKATP